MSVGLTISVGADRIDGRRSMKRSIVLIHGAWLAPRSWENFETYFKEKAYDVFVPEWPRKADGVEAQRRDPSALAGLGIKEIVDHLEGYVRQIPEPPVIVGHSFGGLFTLMLLDRGVGAAGVAMDPAPPKGILTLPPSQLKSASPALAHPSTRNTTVTLTLDQFTYGFVNTFTDEDARNAYDRYAVPETGRIFYQAAFANFNPHAENRVDYAKADRAPLLITAGEKDHTVPASVSRSIYKKYAKSPARTDLLELSGRPHLLMAGEGWEEVAAKVHVWIESVYATAEAKPGAGAAVS
jgi:pimeloyl-ACP methyl ester carboxylesterase